ncbi:hypothetical protein LTR62_008470 [Meristemomyces frigidus]|uniref:Uncharacterized protein n=1 Tax=Meristemomyces frigidus TaxID=1508187 RepID=A0AAN7YIS8_9PEZI|nr:hypothetical protein LTR62_008470 [Meristemomyces frigidus]
MSIEELDQRAIALLDRLTSDLDRKHGSGCMSVAVYDTAWVSLITKTIRTDKIWLFPQTFEYLLREQQGDGSWPSYASQIDGILNTAASLLSLLRHAKGPLQVNLDDAGIEGRIQGATGALQRLLQSWDVASTVHVGFEILVPAMLEYLQAEGIVFDFPQRETLLAFNKQKLKKFQPEYLYGPHQLTALHSLEAFVGKIEFDKVAHHRINGSFMASPSSTAAYMLNASQWSEDCEEYIRQVLGNGAGQGNGGIPSAFPSTIFELTWSLSTLLEGDFEFATLAPFHASKAASFLKKQLTAGKGATGFAPGLGADADDTAKSMLILSLLHHDVSVDPLLEHFESDHYFKTYPLERDPSFSANCNVLAALLHAEDPSKYTKQIEKVVQFLISVYRDHGLHIRDKWNISPLYSLMLLAQAGARILSLVRDNIISTLPMDMINTTIPQMRAEVVGFVLESQNENGSWGRGSTHEETAYSLLILSASLSVFDAADEPRVQSAVEEGRHYLQSTHATGPEYLWVEKVTYTSEILCESYTLAALKATANFKAKCSAALLHNSESATTTSGKTSCNATNGHPRIDSGVASPQRSAILEGEKENGTGFDNSNTLPREGNTTVTSIASAVVSNNDATAVQPETWSLENEKIVLGPYEYLRKQPGKDLRTLFIAAFNEWLLVPPAKLERIQDIVRMLHTASLLVDDIEDNSDLRRGKPVAHSIFGTAQTFNSGNYVYFLALDEVRKLNNPGATDVFIEELINLHRGQGMELFWRDNLTCPTEEQYIQMASNKTGGLFRLAVRLMQAESPTTHDCLPLVNLLGLQFQICDDYLNLCSTTYTHNKGLCEDLTEGKFSFPIIHSVRADMENKELLGVLRQKTKDVEVKKYAVEYVKGTGSFEYTRRVVKELGGKTEALVDRYEGEGWGSGDSVRKLLGRMRLE